MKFLKINLLIGLSLMIMGATAQSYRFVEASSLTMVGKMFSTPNPYNRVDTVRFKGFTPKEQMQVSCSSGLAVAFSTNSSSIVVCTDYPYVRVEPANATGIAYNGYDLYIKKDGEWLYAASALPDLSTKLDTLQLIENLPAGEKECLLYLPIYNPLTSVRIGVDERAQLKPLPMPFRHRIGVYGSSFTQGVSTSRAGMSYPSQLSRMTGLQMLNLGCSGNAKMQPYFADVLCAAEVDAFLLDVFSNPDADVIKERLFPFIEKVQSAHPNIPLIFQRTIRPESWNFCEDKRQTESYRMHVADSLMAIAVKKYPHVYYIVPDAAGGSHENTVDGLHPDNYGYTQWAASIRKPLLKILKKYGIR